MWKAATAQEPEDVPNIETRSLYTSEQHPEALESLLPKHLLGTNTKVAKLCRLDYSSNSSALYSTNSTSCTFNMSDALSDSLFLELNALQSSHNANYELTAGTSGLGLLGGLAGVEPGQQAIGNTALFGSNHDDLSDLATLNELDAWALMQQQAQQNEQTQEQVLVLQQGQLAELQLQLQNAQIQEAPLRQQQLHLQQQQLQQQQLQQQQLQLLQMQGGLQGGLLSLPANAGQQPQSQPQSQQQVWLSSSLTQNNALLTNFNMQQQAAQQQQLLSGSAIQAQQQHINNRAQVERLLASIAQTRGMSSTPLLPDQQQQLHSASAVLIGSKPSSSTASLPLGNNPMVALSMPKGQPTLISAPQLGAATNINMQSLMGNGTVSRSIMNVQPSSLNPAAAAALQLAQMSPSASILAGSGGIGGINTIQHRSKMPNLTQLQNAPVAIGSPTVANAGHATAVTTAAGLTMRPATLPRHPALGATNQRVLGTTVRAQPPSWAGADWNPRAAAASASTASAGTGVFLPQFQRPPSSGATGDKASPPTSGNTLQSPPASDASTGKTGNHNGNNNVHHNGNAGSQDGNSTPTAAANASTGINSTAGSAAGTARVSANGSTCEVGPAPVLLNTQANNANRPHAAQPTYTPIVGTNTGNLAALQARLQAQNMLQQMQQQQQLQLQLQNQQAQQQLQQQALRMQQLSLQQDNSNSLRLHALQQDNNPGSGTLNWCVLQPPDDLGLDGFVTTSHQS